MDRINADGGFMPGVFGRGPQQPSGTRTNSGPKLQPKPHDFWKRFPEGIRNEFLAMSGEFVGTFMFLFFAFAGTQVANTPVSGSGSTDTASTGPNTSALLYIALSFGFSLAVNAWIFFRVTGGLFNPAVTLGLCLIGAVPFSRGALVFVAQMLGAMASAGVVEALFPGPLAVTTTLSAGTSLVQGVFIEMFLTAQLVFTIFMLAAEKHKSTFLAPVGIGLALFIAEIAGVYYTGGSLNPARSFGPCVALRSFPSDHWIYWVGPLLGALIASGFFWFIKSCEYETVNPGQDFDDLEDAAFNPDVDLTRPVVHPTAQVEQTMSRGSDNTAEKRMSDLMDGQQPNGYAQRSRDRNSRRSRDGNERRSRDGYDRRSRDGYDRKQQQVYETRRQGGYEGDSRATSNTYTIGPPHTNAHISREEPKYTYEPPRM